LTLENYRAISLREVRLIPTTHHGSWRGPNRLWMEDPTAAERSDGTLEVSASSVKYSWAFQGAAHHGEISLSGPAGALAAAWTDTWHAATGMSLHGFAEDGRVLLFGTYPAGDGPDWGWRIELDSRDPEHFVLRMFNVPPSAGPVPAVDLRGAR
jgi:hypothetical protein